MVKGYVRRDGFWAEITGVGYYDGTAWQMNGGDVREGSSWSDFTNDRIEDMEGSTYMGDHFRGSESGNSAITSNAALASTKGSTQGMECNGFVERYSLASDNANPIFSGVQSSFYFRPHNVNADTNEQYHFLIAPQPLKADPPNWCYRYEMHMNGSNRLAKMSGDDPNTTRDIHDFSNDVEMMKAGETYKCRFEASASGVWIQVDGITNSYLSTTDTEYVDNLMGFGFRCGTTGKVDYDWLTYEETPPSSYTRPNY